MIKLLILLAFPLLAQADVHLYPGDSIFINNQRVTCHGNGSGQGHQESRVDQACLKYRRQNYRYTPNVNELISWANECRGIVASPPCQKVSETHDTSCTQLLVGWYSYTPDERTLGQFERACRVVGYTCP